MIDLKMYLVKLNNLLQSYKLLLPEIISCDHSEKTNSRDKNDFGR